MKTREKEQEIPADIIEEILSRLTVKSLMRFRCVSKQWRNLFINPAFITKHLNQSNQKNPTRILVVHCGSIYTSEIESGTQMNELHLLSTELPWDPAYAIEAICDGLVCLTSGKKVGLYNPATREFLLLLEEEDYCKWRYSCFGLGFDSISKKYKVVKVTNMDDGRSSVKIYTLGSHRWRSVHRSLPFIWPRCPNASVTLSGVVHWVALPKFKRDFKTELLISFDFQGEVFQEVPLPEFGLNKKSYLCVGVLGGCLSVSANFTAADSIDIWVMKEYGVKESWTKLFSMSSVGIYWYILRLGILKDGEILLQKDESELILYNPKSKTDMKLGFFTLIHGRDNHLHSFKCVSLILTDGRGYRLRSFKCTSLVESLVCLSVESGRTTKS